ncbi:hypothetical protein NECAME_02088 [Necator americanus]|uniref:Uncharacterized protein n=1 Tax=Necator americanus TaxID=51031 RepID=W2TJ50_NECAM|nr:hypothetical protein NECAME_02088 [Necator americanus]ETN81798.1 hypothetical protein NECAME_02088 [Necator americanus]
MRSIECLRMFKSKNPEDPNEVPEGFLSDVNKYTNRSLFLNAHFSQELKAVSQSARPLLSSIAQQLNIPKHFRIWCSDGMWFIL